MQALKIFTQYGNMTALRGVCVSPCFSMSFLWPHLREGDFISLHQVWASNILVGSPQCCQESWQKAGCKRTWKPCAQSTPSSNARLRPRRRCTRRRQRHRVEMGWSQGMRSLISHKFAVVSLGSRKRFLNLSNWSQIVSPCFVWFCKWLLNFSNCFLDSTDALQ